MVGYDIYYIPRERDEQTGEECYGDPIFLHLSYNNYSEAERAQRTLEMLYGINQIEVSVRSGLNTYCPGEGA